MFKEASQRKTKSDRQSATLSKNALYTPLVAFESDGDPSLYMASRKKVPTSIRESSLMDFLQSVSVDYHRNSSTSTSKNNGGRPLSLSDVDDRIRQRALTLIGGGINASLAKKRARVDRNPDVMSNRKQKRIISEARLQHVTSVDSVLSVTDTRRAALQRKEQTLAKLTERWNDYIKEMIGPPGHELNDAAYALASSRLGTCELIGGVVRIKKCPAHKSWVGKEGMVTEETSNTWKILRIQRVEAAEGPTRLRVVGKELVVPKMNAELSFRVQTNENEKSDKPKFLVVVIDGNSRR
jgi:RNase P/RNase MRP subunit p29